MGEAAEPPCPHFGTCGGCTLYHLPDAAYIAGKSDMLATALRRAGFADIALSPPARVGPGERRRMDLAARRARGGVVLGLHRQRSAEVVDLTTCLVLHPTLVGLMPPLRDLLARAPGSSPRRLSDRQSARLRRRFAGAHRCATCTVGSPCPDRICPQPSVAAHRLGARQRRTGTDRDTAPADDVALRRRGRAAARRVPAGFRIG